MATTTERRLGRLAAGFNARARQYKSLGLVSWETLVLIHVRFGGRCHYCGTMMDLDGGSWDHAIALSDGGRNDVSNIVRCCITCQRKKFTKNPAEFEAHQKLTVTCGRPGCGNVFKPRWAEYVAGRARYCSHSCAGAMRWQQQKGAT